MPEHAIEIEGLSRRFGSNWAVQNLSMQVPKGSVYGFLGVNGTGKSTTIRMLMGLLSPHEGTMSVLGIDPITNPIAVRRRVGYVPDIPVFYEWMTVQELAAFVASHRQNEWDANRADHLMKRFDLPPHQKVKGLSKGQRTRVSLLLALAFNPEVLILDEPTGGLDPIMRRQVLENVLEEYMDESRTILVSSHLINEISGIVDYVGILKDGRMLCSKPTDELLAGLARMRVMFEGDAPAIDFSAALQSKSAGREWNLVIRSADRQALEAIARNAGGTLTDAASLNLEDAFVAMVGGKAARM